MKNENRIEEKEEHSQRVEKPNQDSNSALLGMVEQKWKDEEEWRTLERKREKREKRESLHNKFCTKWSVVKFFHQNEV